MNDQEIFTLENENNERKHELIKLIDSGEAILIVGAGSSKRIDYPDWSCLLKKLENLAVRWGDGFQPNEGKSESAPLVYAEEIKSSMYRAGNLGKYHALLYRLFNQKDPPFDNFHRRLVSLPFRGILTTNYDPVLEAALHKVEPSPDPDRSLVVDGSFPAPVHEFLMEMLDKSIPRRIAHLHGKFTPPDSIILSLEDYERAYGLKLNTNQEQEDFKWTLHRKLLWALLATRRVVFIGFSMEDPYIKRILYAVSKDLWGWDKSTHYAILGLSPDRNEYSKVNNLKGECGIDTVFYQVFDDPLGDPHQGLYDIVAEIAEECGVEVPTTIPQEQSNGVDHSGDDEPESVTSDSGDVLGWLEQNNQDMARRIDDEN